MVALDRQAAWLEALTQPAVAAVGDSVEATCREGDDDPFSGDIARRAAPTPSSRSLPKARRS